MTDCELLELAAKAIKETHETLQGIANANWQTWEELASPHEYVEWAKRRARHALIVSNSALAEIGKRMP